MFAWYDKRRCLQYCLYSDTPGRLHSARLAWPGGTVLKVRRAWQGTVLGIAVDLNALSYLLCLIPGPSPSGRPRLVVPSWPRPCRSELDCVSILVRPSGRGPNHCLGLSLCIWAGPGGARCRNAICCAEFFAGKWVH